MSNKKGMAHNQGNTFRIIQKDGRCPSYWSLLIIIYNTNSNPQSNSGKY
jgi:hypothetical protein